MLSIVSTPIGNLGDITLRAIETLKKCDAIVCEDTRVTGSLLKHLSARASSESSDSSVSSESSKKELISMHGYTDPRKVDAVVDRLARGAHIALVSDAGTPGISDPGYALVSRCRESGIAMEVIPGPAAFLAALSGTGLPINRFTYLGFLPLKKGRKRLLAGFRDIEHTIVFYESVHRIEKTLGELADVLKDQPDRPVVIARELTKLHEDIVYTNVHTLVYTASRLTKKGEFVVVVGSLPRGTQKEADVESGEA